jgi:hypothetical protein
LDGRAILRGDAKQKPGKVDVLSHLAAQIDLAAAEIDTARDCAADLAAQGHTNKIAFHSASHIQVLAEDEQRADNALIGRHSAGCALQKFTGLYCPDAAPKQQHGQDEEDSPSMHKGHVSGDSPQSALIIEARRALNHLKA